MKKTKLPGPKSVQKLAEFWDAHDVSDFEDELEVVTEPVFVRGKAIQVPLEKREADAVEKLAKTNGVSIGELIRSWVLQNIPRRSPARRNR